MKNILVLFDGTGMNLSKNLTNIAKLAEISAEDEMLYLPGVGANTSFRSTIMNIINRIGAQAFGWGVETNIIKAYTYLMSVYEPGDKVYLIGHSRGAIEARGTAGVIHKVGGILHAGNEHLIPEVAKAYLNQESIPLDVVKHIMKPCVPYFLGLFDSVASRGILSSKVYPIDFAVHPDIKYVYQAVAIHEKRVKFKPLLLQEPPIRAHQTIEQVWFKGVHSDIGGFTKEHGLSDITLHWMLSKAICAGLKVNHYYQMAPNPHERIHESYTGLWKLWKEYHRVIPEGAKIHKSVLRSIVGRHSQTKLPIKYTIV